jgi:hypothetical protein
MACFGAHGLERPQLPRTMLQTTKITRNLATIAAKLPNILLLKDAHCIGERLFSPGVTAEERHHFVRLKSTEISYLSSQAATLLCKQGPGFDLERVALGN